MSWIARLFGRARLEESLDRELRFHIDSRVEDLMRGGIGRDEALRRARIDLGGIEQVKEDARDARGTRMIEDFLADIRYSLRGMSRAKVFSAAVILTLALGIGASTAVWSVLDALVFRALPVERPEQLRVLRRHGNEDANYRLSYPGMKRLQASLPTGVRLAAMSSSARMYASTGGQPEGVIAELVTGEWFSVLGVRAGAGRLFTTVDDRELGGHPVVVVSERYLQRKFGGDLGVVGKTIRVNGTPLTVVGVAQPGFTGLTVGAAVDMWIPVQMQQEVRYAGNASNDNGDLRKPWVPQDEVQWLTVVTRVDRAAEGPVGAVLGRTYREILRDRVAGLDSLDAAYALREQLVAEPIAQGFSPLRRQYSEALRAMMAGVALLLLIACANVSGLLLARSAARTHEIALRMSLGARPGRIVRQVMTESITLALIGGALGLALARWGTQGLLRLASGTGVAVPLSVPIDARLLAFAFGVSLLTGLIFGSAPAFRARRTNLHDAFKTGGRVKGGAGHRLPLGRAMVVSQIALSLLLVTTAGLFVKTFQNLLRIETGLDRDRVLTARIDLRSAGYADDQLPALEQRLLAAVRGLPGVKSASISQNGVGWGSMRIAGFAVPGRRMPPDQNQGQVNVVSQEFFNTVGVTLLKGRQFTDADRDRAPLVTVVSEATAKHFFGTTDVIGQRIGYGAGEFEIVGVVADARVNGIREAAPRQLFYPLAQRPQDYPNSIELRMEGAAEGAASAVKAAIASVDPGIPVREVVTLENLLQRGLVRERMVARLGTAFGGIALLLAGLGLYGVLGYSVSRRTNEMGIRLALGASPSGVALVVMRDALVTVAVGLTLGAALSLPAMGLLGELVWGLSPHDPATLVRAVAMLLAAGVLAGLFPALRAARIDPMDAMRAE